MRILIGLLLVLGLFFLIPGISAWVNAPSSGEFVGAFMGLTFGISFTIIGGSIILIDLIIFTIYMIRKRKKSNVTR